jgi:hypothetical protein
MVFVEGKYKFYRRGRQGAQRKTLKEKTEAGISFGFDLSA